MGWNAKPSGGYEPLSAPWKENLEAAYYQLSAEWTLTAFSGMGGNIQSESGWNPWRWQSDKVSLTDKYKGYGLPQFTPAYGYINDYGVGLAGYSPNLSVTTVTAGATPEDGYAQITCIDTDRAGKFLNRSKYCSFADIRDYFPMSNFKKGNNLWLATVAWLYHYEFPAAQYRTYTAARARYENSVKVFTYLNGKEPDPYPTPPDPPDPSPSPAYIRQYMPIYMYPGFRKQKG